MRFILPFLALMIVGPPVALAQSHERRFVLIVYQITERGEAQPLPFESNTFSTEASCEKAGLKLQQQLARTDSKSRIVFTCLDRGSAT